MNARILLVALLLLTGCDDKQATNGFAGLGQGSENFAAVVPGKVFSFPADHGAHPDFRIEWWYVTANLSDAEGRHYGAQWTLFRSVLRPGANQPGWHNGNLWLGHAGLTTETRQFSVQTQGRGGIGQAGVTAAPFSAWIDNWSLTGDLAGQARVQAQGPGFAYRLDLAATGPLVLQGEGGVSRKSASGQASYYYSQPFFQAQGELEIEGRRIPVKGQAWLDREWSSQHLAADQLGWDWFSLHLDDGRQLMLYRLRQADGQHYLFGNLIAANGHNQALQPGDIRLTPQATHSVAGREVPVRWSIVLPGQNIDLRIVAVNPDAWMALGTPYWEGPVSVEGSAKGMGYLEMTGY